MKEVGFGGGGGGGSNYVKTSILRKLMKMGLNIFARKGLERWVRQNGGICLEMVGCHIVLVFFWRFLMIQHRKKIMMCLSFLC